MRSSRKTLLIGATVAGTLVLPAAAAAQDSGRAPVTYTGTVPTLSGQDVRVVFNATQITQVNQAGGTLKIYAPGGKLACVSTLRVVTTDSSTSDVGGDVAYSEKRVRSGKARNSKLAKSVCRTVPTGQRFIARFDGREPLTAWVKTLYRFNTDARHYLNGPA